MSAEENKALIAQLYDEVFVNWNLAFLDEIIDPEFVSHDMPPGLPKGAEGLRQFYGGLRTAFPDLRYTVEDLIAEDDRVVVRWRWTATHHSQFLDIPPTGKAAPLTGIAIYRIVRGKIIERWVEVNIIALAQRLGATLKLSHR